MIQLTNLSVELQKAVEAKDVAAIEKQIATLETAIKQVKKYIKDTVYGAKAEGLLYDRFTDPAAAVLNDAKRELAKLIAVETKIESVSALDDTNKYLQFNSTLSIFFNPLISKLKMLKLAKLTALNLYLLSKDGKTATVELFYPDNASKANPVLKYTTNYNVTVNTNGKTVTTTFNRADFLEEQVVSSRC